MQKCPPALLSISLTTLVISSTGIAVEADPSSHVHNVTLFLGNSEAPQLTEAGAVNTCHAKLLAFYKSAKPLAELTPGQWQESDTDHTLCKAGLWGCSRADQIEASTHICADRKNSTVNVAFVVMASDNSWKGAPNVSVLEELLVILNHPGFHVLIHVDQNSSPGFQKQVAQLTDQHSNTAAVSYPLACYWGGASIMAGQLSALADVHYKLNSSCIDLVINLSNSDFPVKDAASVRRQLAGSVDHVHFDYFSKEGSDDTFHTGPDPDISPKDADMFYLPECWMRPVSIPRKDLHPNHAMRRHRQLDNWQIVISSQFWVLSKAAVDYLVTDLNVAYLWHYLQHTAVTDESFVSTAIFNHPQLNATIREGAFKYIGKRREGRLVSDRDVKELMTCKYSFARKFMSGSEALRLTNSSRIHCAA